MRAIALLLGVSPLVFYFGSYAAYGYLLAVGGLSLMLLLWRMVALRPATMSKGMLIVASLYSVIAIYDAVVSLPTIGSFYWSVHVLTMLPIVLGLAATTWSRGEVLLFWRSFALSIFPIAVWSFVDWGRAVIRLSGAPYFPRAAWPFERPTILSYVLFVPLVAVVLMLRRARVRRRRFLWLYFLVLSCSLLATFTKKEIAMALLVSLAALVTTKRRRWLALGILSCAGIATILLVSGARAEVATALRIDENVLETGGRLKVWRGGFEAVRDHPWSGIGVGRWNEYLGTFSGGHSFGGPHNAVLEMAGQYGLISALLYVLFAGLVCALVFRMWRRYPGWYTGFLLVVVLCTLLMEQWSNPILLGWTNKSVWLWILIGIGFSRTLAANSKLLPVESR